MSSKYFEQMEFLLLILKLLLDELLYQFFQLRFPWFGYEWLLEKNLVNESIYVRFGCEIKQINRFGLNFSAFAEILQNDARWVVSQKESFKFHF
jgi:hypothetical protein